MPIVPLTQLLTDARDRRYAVGYFESWDVYSLEATVAAAEAERSPVILGIGGSTRGTAARRPSSLWVPVTTR